MRKKVTNTLALVFFLMLQLAFIASLIIEHQNHLFVILGLMIASGFVLFHHSEVKHGNHNFTLEDIFTFIFTLLGTVSTYALRDWIELSPVIAAGLVGVVASFIPNLNQKSTIIKQIPVAIYCGSFAGMSSAAITLNWTFMFIAGILTGLILVFSKHIMNGYGGKLGTVAFGGVVLSTLIFAILEW